MPDPEVPSLGDSAHDKAMIAKVDGVAAALAPQAPVAKPDASQQGSQVASRPDNIPEKFWDAEKGVVRTDELVKSYTELESKQGKPADPPANEPSAAEKAAAGNPAVVAASEEFAKSGKLSEETYKSLETAGYPKAIVDEYIAAKAAAGSAAASSAASEAFALVGGEASYRGMLSWAGANLNDAEKVAFDNAVVGDSATRKMAIESLQARYKAANGSAPKLLGDGGGNAGGGAGAFASRAEATAAMKDPRYKSDPAFRDTVYARLDAMDKF